jgi:hypothetical protein
VCKDMMRTVDTGKSPTRLLEFAYQVGTAQVCMLHTRTPSVNRSATPSCDQRAGAPAWCLARPPTHCSAAGRLDRNVVSLELGPRTKHDHQVLAAALEGAARTSGHHRTGRASTACAAARA